MAEFRKGNDSKPISSGEAKTEAPYIASNYDVVRVWHVEVGYKYPRLLYRARAELGTAYTHNMSYVYVVPHVNGTMNYRGISWKSKSTYFIFPKPPAKGTPGQTVTYSIPDSDLQQTIFHKDDGQVDLEWFASGVRDVEGAGGFGGYTNERTRSIKIMDNASATVNFYFTQPKWIPRLNYKVSISTPDGIVDVAITDKNQSALKFTVNSQITLGLATVPVDDDNATQIRLAMPESIQALQKWIPYKKIEMLED